MQGKKKLSLILAIITVCQMSTALIGCSEANPDSPDNASGQSNQANTDPSSEITEIEEVPEETEVTDDLPEVKFDGSDYVFLTRNCCPAHTNGIYIEDLTGDVINDAVYDRNLEVEERFDVKIVEPQYDNDGDAIVLEQSVTAGDDAYDSVIWHYRHLGSTAAKGYLLDTSTIGYIGYEKPWWYQNVNDAYSVGGHYYIICGMYDLDNYYDNICTYFNINLMENLFPDLDIYSIVKEGKWTVDKLEELASAATLDVNGDGKMNPATDIYGYAQDNGFSFVYQFAWDQPVTIFDENGYPQSAINTEKEAAIVERLYRLLFESAPVIKNEEESQRMKAFREGRVLFMIATLSTSIELRDMEQDFGILPVAKFDEAQEKHYTHATAHTSLAGIPINKTKERMEKSAIILEAMAAGGFKTVRPAVYDVALKSKYARDDSTYEMIDLVINGRKADFADAFDEWGLTYTLDILVARSQSKDWASHCKTNEKLQNVRIEKAVKQFMKIEDGGAN